MTSLAWLRALLAWEMEVGDAPASRAAVRSVALALVECSDSDGGSCFPGQRHLIRVAGVRGDTVGALRRRWCSGGWLVDTGRRVSGGTVVYRLTVPAGIRWISPDEQGDRHERSPESVSNLLTTVGDLQRTPPGDRPWTSVGDRLGISLDGGDRPGDRPSDLPGRSNLPDQLPEKDPLRQGPDRLERSPSPIERVWAFYEQQCQEHGLRAKPFVPGDEQPIRMLLDGRWTVEQIELSLRAVVARAAEHECERVWADGKRTWRAEVLREALALQTSSAPARDRTELARVNGRPPARDRAREIGALASRLEAAGK